MLLDDAARPVWRALGQRYLAPEGRPLEKGEGDPGILRALHDSAFDLPVLAPTQAESEAFDKALQDLDKAAGGESVWRKLEGVL